MDFTKLTDADHAAALWNHHVSPGTPVYRIDDFGHIHQDETRSRAWVLPSGTAIVKLVDAGPYKLSRVWTTETIGEVIRKHAPQGFEPIEALNE